MLKYSELYAVLRDAAGGEPLTIPRHHGGTLDPFDPDSPHRRPSESTVSWSPEKTSAGAAALTQPTKSPASAEAYTKPEAQTEQSVLTRTSLGPLGDEILAMSVPDAQALVQWTLDDIPILTRTIFNGAKCLEGMQIPMSIAPFYVPDVVNVSPGGTDKNTRYRYGVRTHAFEGGAASAGPALSTRDSAAAVPSEDLWTYGDNGRGFSPARPSMSRGRESLGAMPLGSLALPPSPQSKLGEMGATPKAIDRLWHDATSALQQSVAAEGNSAIADDELPLSIKGLLTTHRKELHRLFTSWEVNGVRVMHANELVGEIMSACPDLSVSISDDDIHALVKCAKPLTSVSRQYGRISPQKGIFKAGTGARPPGVAVHGAASAWERVRAERQHLQKLISDSNDGNASAEPEDIIDCQRLWRKLHNFCAAERSTYVRSASSGSLHAIQQDARLQRAERIDVLTR